MTRDQKLMGIFGPTQVCGKVSMTTDERFLRDAAFVNNAGWRANLNILKNAVSRLISPNRHLKIPIRKID